MNILGFIRRFFHAFFPQSLIHPRLKTLADMSDYVDLNTQPIKSIVSRAYFRATQNVDAKTSLGETPILNGLLNLEEKDIFDLDQLPLIHGHGICGNMYTQHPDRLIPFWLRQKEMNLTNLTYQMLTYSDTPDLTTRPLITQCFMEIVSNLNDIRSGALMSQQVLAETEAEFVAIRRTDDIKTHLNFLKNSFIIWAARSKQRVHSPIEKNRSKLIKALLQDKSYYRFLCHHFWHVDQSSLATMHRSMIWHDTDTNITIETVNLFIRSCYFQLHYGAKLVSNFLPLTPFDIDPSHTIITPFIKNDLQACLTAYSSLFGLPSSSSSDYQTLQLALIDLNHHLSSIKNQYLLTLEDLEKACHCVHIAQTIARVLATINPVRFGIICYLINQLAIYLSVTARIRDADLFEFAALHSTTITSDHHLESIVHQLKRQPPNQLKNITIHQTASHSLSNTHRSSILNDCHRIWRIISTVAPVHVTVADFGTHPIESALSLGQLFLPSPDSVLFLLPETPPHTKACIELFEKTPLNDRQHVANVGVLLGKSDQIKRSRAPFFTLSLNLKLARLAPPNLRYVGNGSTILRGGTLTHLSYSILGQSFGLGKTVQQGDGFRSIVNEYIEFSHRTEETSPPPVSLFETVALFCGESPSEVIMAYQTKMASIIASGVLDHYPIEASRSHFKYKASEINYAAIMKIKDFKERQSAILTDILPNLRAIPEVNIALSHFLYPIEQDEKVCELYTKLCKKRTLLSRFYSNKVDHIPLDIDDSLRIALTQHRQELDPDGRSLIINEITYLYRPPVVQFAVNMVLDTLRQLPHHLPIRSRYERILKCLDPTQIPPAYSSITDSHDELMSYRPI